MNLAEKKETLFQIVQGADDKLTGLLIALANEYNSTGETYSREEIENFYQVRDQLLKEPETGYSIEKSNDPQSYFTSSPNENVEKKERLLEIVQDADDKLAGLMIALAKEYNEANNSYSTEELDFFSSRQKAFFENNKKGATIEEVHDRIRRKI